MRDPSNGLRLFSRRVIDEIAVESDSGFCYSIELLVKCHRLGWPIGEVPIEWYERTAGQSRFRVHEMASQISALVFLRVRDDLAGRPLGDAKATANSRRMTGGFASRP